MVWLTLTNLDGSKLLVNMSTIVQIERLANGTRLVSSDHRTIIYVQEEPGNIGHRLVQAGATGL